MQTSFDRAFDNLRRTNTPFTWTLLGLGVLSFLLSLNMKGAQWMMENGFFMAPVSWLQPWRALTYPILMPGIFALLFDGLALWWFGGSLERSWGTRNFAIFWVLVSLVSALSLSLGALVIGQTVSVASWLPLSAMVLAWCMLNPEQSILIYGIIPILAKWIAVGEVLIIFFMHFSLHPLLGFFALGGCAFALWWIRSYRWQSASFGPSYAAPPRYDTFTRGPKLKLVGTKPSKAPIPPDDRKTWRDYNPLRIRSRRRQEDELEKLERLMRDD